MKKLAIKREDKGSNDYVYGCIFIIFSILLEIANFLTLGIGVFPSSFGVEIAVILMIAGIIFIVPTEWLKITLSTLLLGVQVVLNVINACVYKNLFNITTIDMIFARGGETGAVFELDMLNLPSIIAIISLILLYVSVLVLAGKFAPRIKAKGKISSIAYILLIAMIIEGTGLTTFSYANSAYASDVSSSNIYANGKYLYGSTALKFANMQKYGFYGYYIKSLEDYLGYKGKLTADEKQELADFISYGDGYKYTGSQYDSADVSGALEGDNLIVVMIESGEWFAVDPFNTPTLYEFMHNDSVALTNFYSRNPTNFSEDIAILGNTPNDYAFSRIIKRVGINTPESLPNLFKDAGYESVKFFHDYLGTFYDREAVNSAFGFDDVFTLEDCTLDDKSEKFGDFVDDGEFVKNCQSVIMPTDKQFFSFFTSVTMHGPYTGTNYRLEPYYEAFENNYEDFCDWAETNNLGYILPKKGTKDYKILKEYKAKAMALENMIVFMLDYLENTSDIHGDKLIDKTSIVMFADHNTYYQDLSYKIKGVGEFEPTSKSYNVPFTIFNKKLAGGEFDVFCNTYDIFPTICDLYGLEFNRSLAQGYSVFSTDIEKSVFVSSMAGIFDKNVYSLTMQKFNETAIASGNFGANISKFKEKVNNFIKKQRYIEMYYTSNFVENGI